MINNLIYNKIYDILMEYAGAVSYWRRPFIDFMSTKDPIEFRFIGKLGFGGKYWVKLWKVNCYTEDMNVEKENIINKTNEELRKLYTEELRKLYEKTIKF